MLEAFECTRLSASDTLKVTGQSGFGECRLNGLGIPTAEVCLGYLNNLLYFGLSITIYLLGSLEAMGFLGCQLKLDLASKTGSSCDSWSEAPATKVQPYLSIRARTPGVWRPCQIIPVLGCRISAGF